MRGCACGPTCSISNPPPKEGRKSLTSLWHSAHRSTRSNGLFVGNAGAPACECAPERRVFRRGTESRSNARSTVRNSAATLAAAGIGATAEAAPRAVVELFTSQGCSSVSPRRRAAHQARARARPDSAVAAGRLLGSARLEGHPGAPQLYRATEGLCRQARRRHGLYAAGCDQRARGRRRLASLRHRIGRLRDGSGPGGSARRCEQAGRHCRVHRRGACRGCNARNRSAPAVLRLARGLPSGAARTRTPR